MPDLDDHLTAARHAISAMEPRADLWARAVDGVHDSASSTTVAGVHRSWSRRSPWLAAAAVVAVAALGAGLLQSTDDDQSVATVPQTTGGRSAWSGPVRETSEVVHTMAVDESLAWDRYGEIAHGWMWDDPRDAANAWVDITRVSDHSTGSPRWNITLAGLPPAPADLEPGVVIAYGLVFDVDGDNAADYVVGLDTDATLKGEFRAWVTNVATGETNEQDGPPYGFPVEFAYPFEPDPGQSQPLSMVFTFIGGIPTGIPAGLQVETTRFYAWSSMSRGGVVVAHDYAPDAGWIARPSS